MQFPAARLQALSGHCPCSSQPTQVLVSSSQSGVVPVQTLPSSSVQATQTPT
ncbi:hypothetical protein G6O69_02855 [Pseudenhygromyxa sp. WMMC2535]|uniref:hypothetical protein n=1 Tax=Pseudenhygromyxa sp. WMMC2535 TaxID=2712867 RepID=UPI001595D30E|nr:hypothetical protein [Pseudenhygromyxa sp. WMMC2535]NVB36756.1 hypothetical protein [Pseudenhygromyxa sp. WMMC2535]